MSDGQGPYGPENADEQMALVDRGDHFVPKQSEEELNADLDWKGMPRFEPAAERFSLVLSFDAAERRDELVEQLGLIIAKKTRGTWSAWWPPREKEDLSALRFDFGDAEA